MHRIVFHMQIIVSLSMPVCKNTLGTLMEIEERNKN
jgi:hypothetical protein